MGTITATVTEGATVATGVELSPSTLNSIAKPTVTITTPITIANGGTNGTTASAARTNLGLGSIATQDNDDVFIIGGSVRVTTIQLRTYSVSGLPSAETGGYVVYCTDGDGGNPCLAVDNGAAWKRIALGATVSAT